MFVGTKIITQLAFTVSLLLGLSGQVNSADSPVNGSSIHLFFMFPNGHVKLLDEEADLLDLEREYVLQIPEKLPATAECKFDYGFRALDTFLKFEQIKISNVIYIKKNKRNLISSNKLIKSWEISPRMKHLNLSSRDHFVLALEPENERDIDLKIQLRCKKKNYQLVFTFRPVSGDVRPLWQKQGATSQRQGIKGDKYPSLDLGLEVYRRQCAACHGINGEGIPPIFPALVKNDIIISESRTHELFKTIYNGVPGTAMPSYKQQLRFEELAAVVMYLKSSWGDQSVRHSYSAGDAREAVLSNQPVQRR